MIKFELSEKARKSRYLRDRLGILDQFLSPTDPRPAAEQLHTSYAHGGGWQPFKGFKLGHDDDGAFHLQYPDDPPMREIARATLREETVVLFEGSWVAVIQNDFQFEVSRVD